MEGGTQGDGRLGGGGYAGEAGITASVLYM